MNDSFRENYSARTVYIIVCFNSLRAFGFRQCRSGVDPKQTIRILTATPATNTEETSISYLNPWVTIGLNHPQAPRNFEIGTVGIDKVKFDSSLKNQYLENLQIGSKDTNFFMKKTVSVVVPTYRGADTLPELINRLTSVLTARGCRFEILIVEDGSPDNGATWAVVKELANTYPHVRGFRLLRNRGQHNALLLGIREATFETIVTLDDDLQNPPEEMGRLLDHLEAEGADVVYGIPQQKNHGFVQNLGSSTVRFALALILGAKHARHVTPFRAFRTVLRDSFSRHQSPRVSIDALLDWGATKYSTVIVEHRPRDQGQSGYNFRSLVSHALTMITSYSTMPLRVATLIGFALVILGAGVFVYVILGRLFGYVTEPGFTFVISLISIIGGGQLLALGIVGEYIATIFMRSLGMPSYTLAEKTDAQ